MKFTLPRSVREAVEREVTRLYGDLRVDLLGPGEASGGKAIVFALHPEMSLPGLFEAAAREEGQVPDIETLDSLLHVAGRYLDAHEHRARARAVQAAAAAFKEVQSRGEDFDAEKALEAKLTEVFQDAAKGVHDVVDTEASMMRNTGVLGGIMRANALHGISDPMVYFVVVRDSHLCDECRRLHLMEDGVTPRVWLLSEVGAGYHKRGEEDPKVGGLHPHCRCSLVTILPGYGFDKSGRVKYVAPDHNELTAQRSDAES